MKLFLFLATPAALLLGIFHRRIAERVASWRVAHPSLLQEGERMLVPVIMLVLMYAALFAGVFYTVIRPYYAKRKRS